MTMTQPWEDSYLNNKKKRNMIVISVYLHITNITQFYIVVMNKNPEISSLSTKAYFGLWFQSIVTWIYCFWVHGKVVIMMEMRQDKLSYFMVERKTKDSEWVGDKKGPPGHAPSGLLLPPRPCLLNVPLPPSNTTQLWIH